MANKHICAVIDCLMCEVDEEVPLPSTNNQGTGVSAQPGIGVPVAVTLQGTGNTLTSASLSVSSTTGLTVSGLSSPVTLNAGQTTTQTLTLTPATTATPAAILSATVTAIYGPANSQTAGITIAVTVTAAQAQAAFTGAQNAAALGRTDIATTLSGLSGAIDAAVSSCSATTQAQMLAYVDNLIQEMNAPFLANFVTDLGNARAAIASSTCANINTALNQLSTVLSNLATVLTSPAAFPFDFELIPNTAVAQPNQAATFQILLRNDSTTSNTYTLSLGALPNGVTGNLNQSSITLAAGQSSPLPGGLAVTLTPGSHYENHQRAAELHDSAAHTHRSAAEDHEKQDHQTGQERSRQALEHPQEAYQHTEQAHRNAVNEHGIALFGHEDIAALAHKLWQDRGSPEGSPEEDWFHAAQELRARAGGLQK